ncbi:citryl-CoA lyase [Novosphingobium marinum]|uniref:Citrate lyase subunit beta/citryl-CoA lyase n=1 Tax=Novosphingobium marinum TaxID=1514948 RepID=A0A7Y9XXG0_9SPHN|nr:aldolase/citrate lyase family protein [Novosphingobium marinum]NYH96205.1 citrate lyase subunit beta/citryl-CoA lyase [Novosphingobium marinum]GGC33295.1 citryl-CoA lyase [Novosphingobium marinum]
MNNRSWLVVPANREASLADAVGCGADAIVLDLAGLEGPEQQRGRELASEWLAAHRRQVTEQRVSRWVRINPLDTSVWRPDLVAAMRNAPDGILLPGVASPNTIRQIGAEIYEFEQRGQIATNSTQIVALVGDTPRAALALPAFLDADHQRLAGLAWDAESLGASIGATRTYDAAAGWADTFRYVRAQTLLAAHGCGLAALDWLDPAVADEALAVARVARGDGFTGMLCSRIEQVAAINEAFTPSADELAEAQRLVSALDGDGPTGAYPKDRREVDLSRLRVAKGLIELGEASAAQRRPPILRPA